MSHPERPISDDDDTLSPDVDLLQEPEGHLERLAERFLAALDALQQGEIDDGVKGLREILKDEPRLAEPRIELARIALETGNLEEAEAEAREALRLLQAGGQWTQDLTEEELQSLAHGLLGEILRTRSESDTTLFGDPEVFKAVLLEARQHFQRAAELDPENEHAGYYAFHLGLDGDEPEWGDKPLDPDEA